MPTLVFDGPIAYVLVQSELEAKAWRAAAEPVPGMRVLVCPTLNDPSGPSSQIGAPVSLMEARHHGRPGRHERRRP